MGLRIRFAKRGEFRCLTLPSGETTVCRLIESHQWDYPKGRIYWNVEVLLTGEKKLVAQSSLGDALTPLEVIAHAARA